MITQMKNQDPTSPFKAEQMASQIAQFTSVEQLQNVNQNLSKMAVQNRPLEQMAMTNLIGKMVTIDRDRFPHLEGQTESLNFTLPRDATSVHLSVLSEGGDAVLEKDLGAQKAGPVTFNWDGLKSNSLPAKEGSYLLRILAKDDRERVVETNPRTQAKVIGISFEGGEPVFLVGDANHQDKITLQNIIRIDEDLGQGLGAKGSAPAQTQVPAQAQAPAPAQVPAQTSNKALNTSNFFEFKRGVGSAPSMSKSLPPTVNNEIRPEEKGFPNGLHEGEESQVHQGETEKHEMPKYGNSLARGGEAK